VVVSVAPIKLNARQEQFASEVANGVPASVAYAKVYAHDAHNCERQSVRLSKIVRVRERIFQLRTYNQAAARVTLPFLTRKLYEIADLAIGCEQYNAAQSAIMGVAKLHGFLVDRAQVELVLRKPAATPESPDEMDEASWLRDFGLQLEGSLVTGDIPPETGDISPMTDDGTTLRLQSPESPMKSIG
jgi:hypothetical protein